MDEEERLLQQDHAGAMVMQYVYNEENRSNVLMGTLLGMAMPPDDDEAMHRFVFAALMTFGNAFAELAEENGTHLGRDPEKGESMPMFQVTSSGDGEVPGPVQMMSQMMNSAVLTDGDMAHDLLVAWDGKYDWSERRAGVAFLLKQFGEIFHGNVTVIFPVSES